MSAPRQPIVPDDFDVPVALAGEGFRLEPLGPQHNERDHEAWMGSIEHIRSLPGFSGDGDWPVPMSLEDNLSDLEMHHRHFGERVGFTYSVLEGDDVIGCVYIYPASRGGGTSIEVRFWTTEERSSLHAPIGAALTAWVDERWPFGDVSVIGA